MNNMNFSSLNNSFQRVVQHIGYLWDPEPKHTDFMNSIWLLGKEYPPAPPEALAAALTTTNTPTVESHNVTGGDESSEGSSSSSWPKAFLDDFESRVWMTYRSEFSPIQRSSLDTTGMSIMTTVRSHLPVHAQGFTSDQGWGCMVRSGQCVLANTLYILHLGRDWKKGQKLEDEKRFLSLFADDPKAPFSIHKFVTQGESRDIRPGQWFGPTPTAHCIKELTDMCPSTGLQVHMTFDGNVYEDSFHKTAIVDNVFKPTLLLVVTRLGVDGINPLYWEALKVTVQLKQSIGIAGGRPSSSHYFVGVQGDYLFYLDPHIVRPKLPLKRDPSEYTSEEVNTSHTRRLRRLHVKDMDPSMLFAFLIRDENEWQEWRRGVVQVQGRSVITVGDRDPGLLFGGEFPRQSAMDEVISDEDGEGLQ